MHCILVSYSYQKSIPGPAVSGFKNGETPPKNAVAGMNGTYKLASTPPKVFAVVRDRFDCPININLYYAIKKELDEIGMRVSEKRVNKICEFLMNNHLPFEIVLDGHNHWIFRDFNLRNIIDKRTD